MHETRPRRDPRAVAHGPSHEEPLDDWLGDISDDDWSESPSSTVERGLAPPADEQSAPRGDEVWADPTVDPPARPVSAAEGRRAIVERRRRVAGLVVAVLLALAVAIPVLLLRSGDQAPVTPANETTSTPSIPDETTPPPPPATPSTTPPSPTPSTGDAPGFTLPEGTKLRRTASENGAEGEAGDPALITELQKALSAAGFDPGPVDGTYGRRTEAAVAAFQEANGLSVDGVVGPETAAALNDAVAAG